MDLYAFSYRFQSVAVTLTLTLSLFACSGRSLPEYYGVYASDGEAYVRLREEVPREERLSFNGTMSFLFFDKSVATGIADYDEYIQLQRHSYVRYEVKLLRSGGKTRVTGVRPVSNYQSVDATTLRFRPVEDNPEMIEAVPQESLDPGQYMIRVGENHFPVSVTGDTASRDGVPDYCVDRYVASEGKELRPDNAQSEAKSTSDHLSTTPHHKACRVLDEAGTLANTAAGPVFLPGRWQMTQTRWWSESVDTSQAFRRLSSVRAMGVVEESSSRRSLQEGIPSLFRNAVKQELVALYRNNPEVVDSLFQEHVRPVLEAANLSISNAEELERTLIKYKNESYRAISQHFMEPQRRAQELDIYYPDSLRHRETSGEVLMQLFLNSEGAPQSIELLRGIHPVLNAIAMRVTASTRWSPACIMQGRKRRPISSWVRFGFTFRPPPGA